MILKSNKLKNDHTEKISQRIRKNISLSIRNFSCSSGCIINCHNQASLFGVPLPYVGHEMVASIIKTF